LHDLSDAIACEEILPLEKSKDLLLPKNSSFDLSQLRELVFR